MLKQIEPSREDMVHYAVLDATPEELESVGIWLSELFDDDPGPVREATVLVPSGTELLLIEHDSRPDLGITVKAPIAIDGPNVAYELADAMGLPHSRISWIREEGIDWSQYGASTEG
jgi:hypothetical protein